MNILLTGISKGLGMKTAEMLLRKGCVVFGISRKMTKELDTLLQTYPDRLKWLEYDLNNCENIKEEIFKKWIGFDTPIHAFVNNAAIAYDDIVTNMKLELVDEMFRVNVFSPMVLTKYVVRHMLLNKISGSIVHISSISVHTGYKGLSFYAATKGALEAYSKNTAREWGEKGIRSNCLVSGFMETDMSSNLSNEQKNRIYQRTSLKKPVEIESVSETILFLISNESSSITGQNIYVDNGTI